MDRFGPFAVAPAASAALDSYIALVPELTAGRLSPFAPVPRVNFAFCCRYLGSDQEILKLHFEEIERAAG
jgi:hypothetical protein